MVNVINQLNCSIFLNVSWSADHYNTLQLTKGGQIMLNKA